MGIEAERNGKEGRVIGIRSRKEGKRGRSMMWKEERNRKIL